MFKRRILSISLSLLLVLSFFPATFNIKAISSTPTENYTFKHFTDDFDSADSMDHWITNGVGTSVSDDELPYRMPEDLSAAAGDINCVMMPAYRTTANTIATTVDRSVLPSGKILSYSLQMKAVAASGWQFALISYADTKGNYAYTDFNFSEVNTAISKGVLSSRASKLGNGITTISPSGSGAKYIVPTTGTYAINPVNSWITITCTYDYSLVQSARQLKITYKVSGSSLIPGNTTDTVEKTFTYTFGTDSSTGLSLYDPNFSVGMFNSTTSYMRLDNAVIKTESSAALETAEIAAAQNYASAYSGILTKSASSCTIEADKASYYSALDAYTALSDDVKAWLSPEKAHLDEIYQKFVKDIPSDFYDDFEASAFTNAVWSSQSLTGTAPASFGVGQEQSGNKYLSPPGSSDSALTVKDSLWSSGKPVSASMRFKISSGSGWTNGARGLFYYDPLSKTNAGFETAVESGALSLRFFISDSASMTVSPNGGQLKVVGTNTAVTGVSFDQWVTVSAIYDYSLWSQKKLIINYTITGSGFSLQKTFTYTLGAASSDNFQIALGGTSSGNYAKFDTVSVDGIYLTDRDKADIFKTQHAEILSRNLASLQDGDTALYNEAITDYNQLNASVQSLLAADGTLAKLNAIATELGSFIESRSPDDFSNYSENFESTLHQWTTEKSSTSAVSDFQIVTDPESSSNKVLYARSNGAVLIPNAKLWPKYGQMTSVSFRMRVTSLAGNAFNKNRIFSSFLSYDNYNSAIFNQSVSLQNSGMLDGNDQGGTWTTASAFSSSGWFNVSIIYTGRTAVITMKDDQQRTLAISHTVNYLNGSIAFGTPYVSGNVASPIWIDDIKVSFTKGNFDVNDEINDIEVYYSGNTFVAPGETALIEGENLGNTVDTVSIQRLSDVKTSSTISFVGEQSYRSLKAEGGTAPTWNDQTAVSLSIIQRTTKSIKFVIPESLGLGVYAVKLKAKNTGASDVILYLNNPKISFVSGDQGETASQGGSIRIIGSNLVPGGVMGDVTVALKNQSGQITYVPVSKIQINDSYSVEASVPAGLAAGDYQVFLHNGYGDATAWSEPSAIKIGAPLSAGRPSTVFNVLDYGAKGNAKINDTPAIISALGAAAQNGGGTVYLPKGVYRVISTIVIPENVVLAGDGKDSTTVMWVATGWEYGDTPDSLISFTGNVEIHDIGFTGSRFHTVFSDYKASESKNISLHDLRVQFYPFAGSPTDGTGASTGTMTATEMTNQISAEQQGGALFDFSGITSNVQIKNIVTSIDNSVTVGCYSIKGSFRYLTLSGCNFEDRWLPIYSYGASIVEDCDFDDSGVGLTGNFYLANNNLHDTMRNNRELYTSDGTHKIDGTTVRFVGPIEEIMGKGKTDSVTFLFMDITKTPGSLVGLELFVVSGQGFGQVRKIVSNTFNTITVDKSFAVAPNRNSLISIHYPRTGSYFVNNTFENGAASGTYGTLIDSVFDGNQYLRHGGQVFNVHLGVTWYISVINAVMTDPFYMQGDGETSTAESTTGIGKWQMLFTYGIRAYSSMGYVFRNNQMLDGSYMSVNWYSSSSPGTQDYIIEKNLFEEGGTGIVSTSVSGKSADGVLLKDNVYNTNLKYSSELSAVINSSSCLNKLGQMRFVELNPHMNGSGITPASAPAENSCTLITNTVSDQYTQGLALYSDDAAAISSQFTTKGYFCSGDQMWTDYSTSASLTFPTNYSTTVANTVQLWLRHTGIAQYGYCDYGIILTTNTVTGEKKLQIATRNEKTAYNQAHTVLAETVFNYLNNAGNAHTLKVDTVDNRILVYWDGVFVLGCADTSRLLNLRGSVGLYTGTTAVTANSITVTSLADPLGGDYDNRIGGNFSSAIPSYLNPYILNNWCF